MFSNVLKHSVIEDISSNTLVQFYGFHFVNMRDSVSCQQLFDMSSECLVYRSILGGYLRTV